MAILQASYISASSHPADTDRLVLEGLLNPPGAAVSGARHGVGTGASELQVTENATPNMSVNVALGHGWVDGTENANQGTYHIYNDATVNLVIAAADATNPRKDLVVLRVQDAQYSGATNAASLAVITGTPAASPAEPTVPANAIVLAMVDVPANDTAITNSQITDRRRRAAGLGGVGVVTSGARPAAPYEGQVIYETDTDKLLVYTGAAWVEMAPAGAWSTYTPANTNITVGNGVQSASFTRLGRLIHARYKLTWGSTTAFGGAVQVGLPAAEVGGLTVVGNAWMLDSGTGEFIGIARVSAASAVFVITSAGSTVNATTPHTWATNDILALNMTYESAN